MYPTHWMGSTDPNVFSGVAKFTVGEKTHFINLESFADHQVIAKMLDAAFAEGQAAMRETVKRKLAAIEI